MVKKKVCFVVAGCLLYVSLLAVPGYALEFGAPGEYRYRVNWLDDFEVDNEGRKLGNEQWEEGRLRINPFLTVGESLEINTQFDAWSGFYGGDEAELERDFADYPWDDDSYEEFEIRQYWVAWTTPVGLLRLGQMSSHWGLGLVANDGEGLYNEWGDAYNGDLVQRAVFATRPLALISDGDFADRAVVAGGYDIVYHDDNADLDDGDDAQQMVFSCFYDHPDRLFTGIYVAIRDQEDDDGDELTVSAYDFYFNYTDTLGSDGPKLNVAFEGVIIKGETDRVLHENAPDEIDVEAFGAVLRGGMEYPGGLRVGGELGYASGDANTYDDTQYSFKFDPNYNAGIILFDEVIASLSAVQPYPLADPDRVNRPQKGIDQLPTNGSVTNAFYQSLFVAYSPTDGLGKNFTVKGGLLHAEAVEDFMDPYLTYENGGVPTNFQGKTNPSRELGWEADGEVNYTLGIGSSVSLNAGVQYGYFWPGAAFEDTSGDTIDQIQKIQTRVSIAW